MDPPSGLSALRQRIQARRAVASPLPDPQRNPAPPAEPTSTPQPQTPESVSALPWRSEVDAAEGAVAGASNGIERSGALHQLQGSLHNTEAWSAYLQAVARARSELDSLKEPGTAELKNQRRNALLRLYLRATRILPISAANRHDPQYLQLWLDLAELQGDDIESVHDAKSTFKLIKMQRIGLDNPALYNAWADLEERSGNIPKCAKLRAEARACRPLIPIDPSPAANHTPGVAEHAPKPSAPSPYYATAEKPPARASHTPMTVQASRHALQPIADPLRSRSLLRERAKASSDAVAAAEHHMRRPSPAASRNNSSPESMREAGPAVYEPPVLDPPIKPYSQSSSRKRDAEVAVSPSPSKSLEKPGVEVHQEAKYSERPPPTMFPLPPAENTLTVNGKPYLALEMVGKGGSSKVYKVLSGEMKICALKRVKVSASSRSALLSYANEIGLLEALRARPTIIQLFDAEVRKSSGVILLVMEYGDIDLAKLLARRKGKTIGNNFRRLYWQQMLEAVQTIHQEKIVHGDLKPANFLHVAGTLKLIDFGIAKAIQTDDTTKIVRDSQIGTPNYMSPEALMAEDDDPEEDDSEDMLGVDEHKVSKSRTRRYRVGRASDIWSLGCILYQMVYGRTPFAHIKNTMHKLNCIQDPNYEIAYPQIGSVVEPNLLDVLSGCLQRDPDKRMSLLSLLSHPFVAQEGMHAQRRTTGATVRENVRCVLATLGDIQKEHDSEAAVKGTAASGAELVPASFKASEELENEVVDRINSRARRSGSGPVEGKDAATPGAPGGGNSLSRMTPTSSAVTGYHQATRTR